MNVLSVAEKHTNGCGGGPKSLQQGGPGMVLMGEMEVWWEQERLT